MRARFLLLLVPVVLSAFAGTAGAGRPPQARLVDAGSGHLPAYRGAENAPLAGPSAPITPVLTVPATLAPAPLAPPTGPTADPPTRVALGVTETESPYSTILSRGAVPAGAVHVQFKNAGEDPHNLLILGEGDAVVARFADLKPGALAAQDVRLAPGTYRLLCTLSAPRPHAEAGMQAELRVEAG